ncbi:hypothetical protein V2H45_00795 [Tumidithrix elongata RA019]|uniref:Uncharacterized protein n=1 Tax=Tumidithrix elongata BACA0141 TaxID=2716417 RepID=A0AAW9PXN4_9CYAN|nr:hypothetical protein [Tumidithrix elongata RA019]
MDSQLTPETGCELEISLVGDEELLYRRVAAHGNGETQYYTRSPEGKINFSKMTFSDRGLKPSVDRACIHEYTPSRTQLEKTDGIIGLIAGNIRAVDDLSSGDSKGKITTSYKIDVIHRPKSDNKAHARIEPSPEYSSDKVFKRLQQKLARLADERLVSHGWEIKPDGFD